VLLQRRSRRRPARSWTALRWEQYLRKVRREEQEKAEQQQLEHEAVAAMTPAEYDAWKRRVPVPAGLVPRLPTRYAIALGDIATEDAKQRNREIERREADAGLPQAQAAHAARVQEIRDERIAAEAEADEAKRAAREREQAQVAELGPCPTLESLEATAA